MQVKQLRDESGSYTIACSEGELALIAEGLYAVQDAGKRCLEAGVTDNFDTPLLIEELKQLSNMCLTIAEASEINSTLHVVNGGR